jgi:hypothetical protein
MRILNPSVLLLGRWIFVLPTAIYPILSSLITLTNTPTIKKAKQ